MCKGIMGFLFGHKFRHVITRDRVQLPNRSIELRGFDLDEFRNETFHAIYCQRCGEVLTKEKME